jgi:hypothetical protein
MSSPIFGVASQKRMTRSFADLAGQRQALDVLREPVLRGGICSRGPHRENLLQPVVDQEPQKRIVVRATPVVAALRVLGAAAARSTRRVHNRRLHLVKTNCGLRARH